MKPDLHPTWYLDAKVSCACGHTFTVGSTQPEIHVEICSNCHPFYTGKQKLVDTARRVERFEERVKKQSAAASLRRGRQVKRQALAVRRATRKPKTEVEEPLVIGRAKPRLTPRRTARKSDARQRSKPARAKR